VLSANNDFGVVEVEDGDEPVVLFDKALVLLDDLHGAENSVVRIFDREIRICSQVGRALGDRKLSMII
jgi:hypothetical protein